MRGQNHHGSSRRDFRAWGGGTSEDVVFNIDGRRTKGGQVHPFDYVLFDDYRDLSHVRPDCYRRSICSGLFWRQLYRDGISARCYERDCADDCLGLSDQGTILNSEKIRQTVYFLGCGGRGLQHHAKSMGDSEVECAGRCIGDYSNRIARLRNAYCFS